jgi:hypothetical protein
MLPLPQASRATEKAVGRAIDQQRKFRRRNASSYPGTPFTTNIMLVSCSMYLQKEKKKKKKERKTTFLDYRSRIS